MIDLFDDILKEETDMEIWSKNDEASPSECDRMSEELYESALRALAKFAIKLAKEAPND